jgi:hypothetical protein
LSFRKEILSFAITLINLEDIILVKMSQTQKENTDWSYSHVESYKTIEHTEIRYLWIKEHRERERRK